MPTCQAKLSDRAPCPKEVTHLFTQYCRWHDPLDLTWQELYEQLSKATLEEKVEIILEAIIDHPEHRLVLPEKYGVVVDLSTIDFTLETLKRVRELSNFWIDPGSAFNPQLENADLQGALLVEANFQRVDLAHANLASTRLWEIDLRRANLFGANLQGADLGSAKLQGAFLSYANLQDAKMGLANCSGAKFGGAKFQGTFLGAVNFEKADFNDTNLENIDLSNTNLSNAYFGRARLGNTRMQQEQLGGAIGEELKHDYRAAKRGYLSLKQNFDGLGDYEAASWAYRKERRMEKLEAWEKARIALLTYKEEDGERKPKKRNWKDATTNYFKYLSDTFIELLCDYGESVWRVVFWMAAFLLVIGPLTFAVLGGVEWANDIARTYSFRLSSLPSSLGRLWFWYYHYLLYTLDTFTTASFSGLRPPNDAVKLASGFFAIAGIVLAGLLGFVAGNRIRRS